MLKKSEISPIEAVNDSLTPLSSERTQERNSTDNEEEKTEVT